ncbi:MAG TPA: hypothetical protein VER11_11000 [Polyangiaceae bacterium]|nr:hypothetical protein [Polyangiaceae bacterium]
MVKVRRARAVLVFALLSAVTTRVHAQENTEEPRTIDTVRGTIRGSTRLIGLGGAFVAIADDTQGVAINPASAAVRLPYSWDPFDYSFGIDLGIATWLPKNDVYNAPQTSGTSGGSLFGSFAILTNYQHVGLGIAAEAEQNVASHKGQQGFSTKLTANFGLMRPALAYGYFDGQLLLGAGLRVLGFSFGGHQGKVPLTAGIGYTAGVIVKPAGQQFRVGVAIEQPINAEVASDDGSAPTMVHVPWTAAMGFAYQFGTRKLNPKFVTAHTRARRDAGGREPTQDEEKKAKKDLFDEYQRDQTWYLLLSTELAFIEGSGDVALAGSTARNRTLVSPRLGVETEVVPRWLRLRAGSYLELATTEEGHSRLHGTAGVDIKLFEWGVFGLIKPFDYWQLSLAADGARSYLNTSFSIGFWH